METITKDLCLCTHEHQVVAGVIGGCAYRCGCTVFKSRADLEKLRVEEAASREGN